MNGIIVAQTVDMTDVMLAATGMDAVDLLQAQARSPKGRVYGCQVNKDHYNKAVPMLVLRACTDGPWDVWNAVQGASHTDPLAQKQVYTVMWRSTNLLDVPYAERQFHQAVVSTLPEGALWPEEYGLWRNDL